MPTFPEKLQENFAKGEPLIFSDFKSIHLLVQLFADLGVSHVFDLAVGNCTAAIAAGLAGCAYDGVCATAGHQAFAESVMDKALLALLSDPEKVVKEAGKEKAGCPL